MDRQTDRQMDVAKTGALWAVPTIGGVSVAVKRRGHSSSPSLCYWYIISSKCCPTETLTSAGVVIYIYSSMRRGEICIRHSSPFFASKV